MAMRRVDTPYFHPRDYAVAASKLAVDLFGVPTRDNFISFRLPSHRNRDFDGVVGLWDGSRFLFSVDACGGILLTYVVSFNAFLFVNRIGLTGSWVSDEVWHLL